MKFDIDDVIEEKGKYWAVVKSSTVDSRRTTTIRGRRVPHYTSSSPLLSTYELEDRIRIINCESIDRPVFVSPNISSENNNREARNNTTTDNSSFVVKHVITIPPISDWGKMWTSIP